ncbi:hypothetical protein ACH4GM_10690 [Streptomyces coeruleorubidus]|uniref:hypothetical protein n=1 Tax=Streptomyces coeruleorubidus TaxID=116188 RepID=UPI0037BCF126
MQLRYFSYISRGKIAQLDEQLSDLTNLTHTKVASKSAEGRVKASAGFKALFGGEVEGKGNRGFSTELVGNEGDLQKLKKILKHMEENEDIGDLNELCKQGPGTTLDCFAYSYRGEFWTLGTLTRERSGFVINESALRQGHDDIVISRDSLVIPARTENALQDSSRTVSNIAIIVSRCGEYDITLSCSYKYFSDMGDHRMGDSQVFEVHPHSGNYHFFEGGEPAYFEGVVFINGVRSRTIYGSPLFLNYAQHDGLYL